MFQPRITRNNQCSSRAWFILHKRSEQNVPAGKEETCEDMVALHGLHNVSVGTSHAFIQVVWFKDENFIAFIPFWSQDLKKKKVIIFLEIYFLNIAIIYLHGPGPFLDCHDTTPTKSVGHCCPSFPNVRYFSKHCFLSPAQRAWQWGEFYAERLNPWHRLDILVYWLLL